MSRAFYIATAYTHFYFIFSSLIYSYIRLLAQLSIFFFIFDISINRHRGSIVIFQCKLLKNIKNLIYNEINLNFY